MTTDFGKIDVIIRKSNVKYVFEEEFSLTNEFDRRKAFLKFKSFLQAFSTIKEEHTQTVPEGNNVEFLLGIIHARGQATYKWKTSLLIMISNSTECVAYEKVENLEHSTLTIFYS